MNSWIIPQHTHLVETYEQFENRDAFEPIKIHCDVDTNDFIKLNQLTEK